jgi:Tfp pilus assembly protein PilF
VGPTGAKLEEVKKALEAAPDDIELRLTYVKGLYTQARTTRGPRRAGRIAGADAEAKKLLERAGEKPSVEVLQAAGLARLAAEGGPSRDPKEAEALFQRAIDAGDAPVARLGLASILVARKEYAEAWPHALEAGRLRPLHGPTAKAVADLAARLAEDLEKTAAALRPMELPTTEAELKRIESIRLGALERYASLKTGDIASRKTLSEEYFERGDADKARRYSWDVLLIDPYDAEAAVRLADVELAAGDTTAAMESYLYADKIVPKAATRDLSGSVVSRLQSRMRVGRARIHLKRGQLDEAERLAREALEWVRDNEAATSLLAKIEAARKAKTEDAPATR